MGRRRPTLVQAPGAGPSSPDGQSWQLAAVVPTHSIRSHDSRPTQRGFVKVRRRTLRVCHSTFELSSNSGSARHKYTRSLERVDCCGTAADRTFGIEIGSTPRADTFCGLCRRRRLAHLNPCMQHAPDYRESRTCVRDIRHLAERGDEKYDTDDDHDDHGSLRDGDSAWQHASSRAAERQYHLCQATEA
jgi:hypothetical protein